MKFICEKSNLQEAVFTVQKAITGKSSMPILNGILIETNGSELILTGSDIDLSITTKIEATILEEGSVIINAKLFGEIIRRLPNDDINIETIDDNTTQILCKKSKFNIINMNTNDFPELPNINENMLFSIPENILKNMIRETIFATAQDETRPILTGILFEIKNKTINLIALDGYRLALRFETLDNDNEINAVIPGKTLNEVSKILEDREDNVDITFTPNHILFNLGKTKIVSRLLEGEFIKYKSIIPEEFNLKVTAKREELLNCIERASLMAKDSNTNLIKLNIEENNMIITSNSQLGMVKEEVNIILQGSTLQIAFNSKYLIDVLKIMDEEEIILNFSSSVSPCVIKNKDKNNCTYLVLPVRLLNN
ncbi:DNA polymerase III subunit beta [Clostridium tyrobutyricum]|jgi:DNA polymerase-3 subunit beta|uniref:Beta sliding clamp n=1 Tax=Clostridium tyrobutyricum DIVETGP TaxID=1408889 RepID=W6N5K0_CLOTY|nr:DNA polymerase III subunit beta [Clostridium tyrobutyricum]AND83272.1 DNA polymerase III subunit beta [Clostridium tyrobutyricum]ANP70790.1 DNA polymerase III subunit beta [Clostridium tyrobutyricum]MBV4429360.1 DNA polymerase III subunit beta [Clostridium tyrobutyricum]MBV4435490.1 DNA polymerase III subunit beta [Clostridium tyrobutyricum]MBV4444564.1 DNA polymerase III subunit beta [Clostridium tyrobutyricum]